MRAGLAINHLSLRSGSESHIPLRNYRPAFESVILGKPAEGLDSQMMQSLGGIIREAYAEADRKGAGVKTREIFHDFATVIRNNIVKLASLRIRDVVQNVRTEHLQDFLSTMHVEMLKNPERADAVPQAMLETYLMSGGKLGSRAIASAVRIGFARSRTLCPREVSQTIRTEYESGRLDCIGEIAAMRSAKQAPDLAVTIPEFSAREANDNQQCKAEISYSQGTVPFPEAVPIAHFLKAEKSEEAQGSDRSSQVVPEIVARQQKEKARRRKEEAKTKEQKAPPAERLKELPKPEHMSVPTGAVPLENFRIQENKIERTLSEAKRGEKEDGKERPAEAKMKMPKAHEELRDKKTEKKKEGAKPEPGNETAGPKAKKKRTARDGERKMPKKPKALHTEKARPIKHLAENAKRKRKAGERKAKKPEFENTARKKNAKKVRDSVAPFKLRSEKLMKRPKEKKKIGPKIEREKIRAEKKMPKQERIPQRRPRPKVTELRVKGTTPANCSMTLRKTRKPETGRTAHARIAARISQRPKHKRPGEIIFKVGF